MHGVVCQHSAYHSIDLSVVTDNIHKFFSRQTRGKNATSNLIMTPSRSDGKFEHSKNKSCVWCCI